MNLEDIKGAYYEDGTIKWSTVIATVLVIVIAYSIMPPLAPAVTVPMSIYTDCPTICDAGGYDDNYVTSQASCKSGDTLLKEEGSNKCCCTGTGNPEPSLGQQCLDSCKSQGGGDNYFLTELDCPAGFDFLWRQDFKNCCCVLPPTTTTLPANARAQQCNDDCHDASGGENYYWTEDPSCPSGSMQLWYRSDKRCCCFVSPSTTTLPSSASAQQCNDDCYDASGARDYYWTSDGCPNNFDTIWSRSGKNCCCHFPTPTTTLNTVPQKCLDDCNVQGGTHYPTQDSCPPGWDYLWRDGSWNCCCLIPEVTTTTQPPYVTTTTQQLTTTTQYQICNYNYVCEAWRGENPITCPSDCQEPGTTVTTTTQPGCAQIAQVMYCTGTSNLCPQDVDTQGCPRWRCDLCVEPQTSCGIGQRYNTDTKLCEIDFVQVLIGIVALFILYILAQGRGGSGQRIIYDRTPVIQPKTRTTTRRRKTKTKK